jgi:Tfp pilus assembly protein PilX
MSQRSQHKGFTLIITVSMMILLAMIAIGMLSLSSISLRSSAQSAQATARANARLAMMIALGELQRTSAIDQSVTMNADLMSAGQSPNP